jgi:hypothetical protein
MKKLLVVLISLVLLSPCIYAMSPLRTWQCRPSHPQLNCSQAEKDTAKNIFRTATQTSLGTLVSDLAAVGVTTTTSQLQKEQVIAQALTTTPSSTPTVQGTIQQQQQQSKASRQMLEEMQQRQQQTIQRISQ